MRMIPVEDAPETSALFKKEGSWTKLSLIQDGTAFHDPEELLECIKDGKVKDHSPHDKYAIFELKWVEIQ